MRKLLVVLTVFMLSFVLIGISPQKVIAQKNAEEYWAVVVGISEYRYQSHKKHNDKAAIDMVNKLKPVWGEDHIKLLTNSAATKTNIKDAICNWLDSKEDSNDVVLFFIACHSNQGFISPHEALQGLPTNDITSIELDNWLDALESQKVVVIIETCWSGTLINNLSQNGRIVLVSSTASESSLGDNILNQFFFPYYILQGLGELAKVDANRDNKISVEELYYYVAPKVTQYAQVKWKMSQNPQMYDGYAGQLILFTMANLIFDANPKVGSITIDGKKYLTNQLPQTFIWLSGTSHNVEVGEKEIYPTSAKDKRYLFTSWSDGALELKRTIKVSETRNYKITADYKTQYYLTLKSERGSPKGEGWYDAGSTATVSVTSEGILIRKVLSSWSGDLIDEKSTTTIKMDGSKTVVANWRTDFSQLYFLVGGLTIIAGGTVVLIKRRRNTS